jgi:hypothetical protein
MGAADQIGENFARSGRQYAARMFGVRLHDAGSCRRGQKQNTDGGVFVLCAVFRTDTDDYAAAFCGTAAAVLDDIRGLYRRDFIGIGVCRVIQAEKRSVFVRRRPDTEL